MSCLVRKYLSSKGDVVIITLFWCYDTLMTLGCVMIPSAGPGVVGVMIVHKGGLLPPFAQGVVLYRWGEHAINEF